MIREGFCQLCGRRFDADPERAHNGNCHDDCLEKLRAGLGICEGDSMPISVTMVRGSGGPKRNTCQMTLDSLKGGQ